MAERTGIPDVETLIKDPTQHFRAPMDVVREARLSQEDKRRILESWCRDAEQISEAENENMTGAPRPRLQEVKLALQELG
jgi:hypothetical protein